MAGNPGDINTFSGGLTDNGATGFTVSGEYTHARNATTGWSSGDGGARLNEPANYKLIEAPYQIIGMVYMYEDLWAICSTDDIDSELGLFRDMSATYTKAVNDRGLNWNRQNLITGVAKMNFDCSWSIYISDNHRNPDRQINPSNIPYKGTYTTDTNGCRVFVPDNPLTLDTDKIKLHPPSKLPCISAHKGSSGGNLPNGTYYGLAAYTANGQKVTNYSVPTKPISLFSHENLSGSVEFLLSDLDQSYDQYEFVVIAIVNQQPVARRYGLFSITQTSILVDILPETLVVVPLEFIPITNPLMVSSNSMVELSDRLLRIGPKSKFDFNYQPLANQIITHFTIVEYPADYYRNGGTNLSAMRDENYNLSIRLVYADSDRSPDFDIPGRAPYSGEDDAATGIFDDTFFFENLNTATITNTTITALGDGGYQIAEGEMGYYETEERYPTNKPEVWGNLCGKKVRHHKFPLRSTALNYTDIYSETPISPLTVPVIRILGVKFSNIKPPVDNDGNLIPNIVGYEILVASREGNKTVIAKGIVNNTFNYNLLDSSGKQGVYPNFPYNDLGADPYISTTPTTTTAITGVTANLNPNTSYNKDLVTFHSPDTMFRRTFLSMQEIAVDGAVQGEAVLKFYQPQEHPMHRLPTNAAWFIATIVGIGIGVSKLVGSRSSSVANSIIPGSSALTVAGATAIGISGILGALSSKIDDHDSIENVEADSGDIVEARDMTVTPIEQQERANISSGNVLDGIFGGGGKVSQLVGGLGKSIGGFLRGAAMGGLSMFVQFWGEGIDNVMDAILHMSQYQQYALQQISHCFYNKYFNAYPLRYRINRSVYLGPTFQEFDGNKRINNFYRSSTVAVQTTVDMAIPTDLSALAIDNTKQTVGTVQAGFSGASDIHYSPTTYNVVTTASSLYASLKERLRNQYGQPGSTKKVPTGCVNYIEISSVNDAFTSPVIFCGDVYITRYTEKNTMYFFYDWLYKQFDGFEFDYLKARMLQYPSYWANTKKFDVSDMTKGIANNLGGSIVGLTTGGGKAGNTQLNNYSASPWLPTGFRALDRKPSTSDTFINDATKTQSYFIVKNAYFYLFVSSVRDFYVESEINLGYRDWDEPVQKRHYDSETYTNTVAMFKADPDVIKSDNFYKYDYSLSASRSFVNMVSWSYGQPVYYDPIVAENCYVYHPRRVIYSLPQQNGSVVNAWTIFKANDYREFKSNISTIKSIGATGAIVIFKSDNPVMIQGNEQLELSVTSITIGSGSFLSREAQSLSNADRSYQVGATQESLSVVNTPSGIYWVCPEQLRIFTITGGLIDLIMPERLWWFSIYMPYNLLVDFPDFPHRNNPVIGIGYQAVYDGENHVVYFTKKDYKFTNVVELKFVNHISGNVFGYYPAEDTGDDQPQGPLLFTFTLEDTQFFQPASWTISYDIREKKWLSANDWHPDLVMPSLKNFNTIKGNGIWRHNNRCDLFCNYYGVDYPFELEYLNDDKGVVNITKSLEYYQEVYKYADNCYDRYMFLNETFDEVVVYNNEQCSGLLKLVLSSPDSPWDDLQYPIVASDHTKVLYEMKENKFRINMFYDLTLNRVSTAYRPIWNTEPNGYIMDLNNANINYNKDQTEQKAFRGYLGYVFLRRKVCGDKRFVMIFAVNKTLYSNR